MVERGDKLTKFSLGLNIRVLRAKSKVTQSKLAEAVGVGQAQVSLWEDNKSIPELSNVYKLKQFFNCEWSDLLD